MKKMNLIESAMKYKQVVLSLVIVMMILGIFGLINMPRREFPEFTIRQGIIVGIYPGANSSEVEEQLTKVVENYIFGYKEINKLKTKSVSREGQMIIYVELNDDLEDADKFWSKLRHGLDELKQQSLPSSVLALVGSNDFGDTSALLITMSSDSKSYRELEEIMKKLEAEIRTIESVSKIKRHGVQDEEIFVYLNQDKLNEYNIKPSTILATFQAQEFMSYAGNIDDGSLIMPVHLPQRFNSEKDLEEQIVFSDFGNNVIRLKDIAHIERKYAKPVSFIRNNGNNALLLSLEMQPGNNIVQFGDDVKQCMSKFSALQDKDVAINTISDLPRVVDHSISHFLSEFLIAILAVIGVTMFLLPIRVSSVAAITIPISILISLGIMQMFGIELHIVSLAGLIVVLGMVVDNAIVVIDNHVEKLDNGIPPFKAAMDSARELFIPVLSATAAIIASFFPLMLFLEGMAGDFVGTFPITIGIALVISLLVAMFMVPFMCFIFIKKGLHGQKDESSNKRSSLLDMVQNAYNKGIEWTFRNPAPTIILAISIVVGGALLFSRIDIKMFPAMDRNQFAVEAYLPEGASLNETEIVIDSLENILLKDERVTNVASFIGSSSPRFNDVYAPHMPSKNFGQLIVNTKSNEATISVLDEYTPKYSNIFANAHVKWKQIEMTNYDAPIEIRISGNNIEQLKNKADEIAAVLNKTENVSWVRSDWGEKRRGVRIDIDKDKANKLGYAKSLVAASLMVSMDGLPITTVWEGDYPVKVVLAKQDFLTNSISKLGDQYVSSPLTMSNLPLRSLAKLNPEWTEGNIVRRNGKRTITVLADLDRNIIPSKVFKIIKPSIDNLAEDGISISYGGDDELAKENMRPLFASLLTSIVLIFFILMFQFKTSRRALLVMSTMLLSFPGAALGLYIANYPFSLTSFIGIIGLAGIAIRNGIILIDYAMELIQKQGLSVREAAMAAGKRRMRPIFLTSMAAAMGVIPMIISQSPLWGPLGAVICFGMIFGMILTLFVLPVLYWKSSDNKYVNKNAQN